MGVPIHTLGLHLKDSNGCLFGYRYFMLHRYFLWYFILDFSGLKN